MSAIVKGVLRGLLSTSTLTRGGLFNAAPRGAAARSARFAAALANPAPRTVASVDPLTITLAGIGATNIASGTNSEIADGLVRIIGGKGRVYFSNVWAIDQFHIDGVGAFHNEPYGLEVVYNGANIEFQISARGQRLHFFVDGVKTNANGYVVGANDASYRNFKLSFATAATRRIRLLQEGGEPYFSAVRTETGYALSNPAAPRPCNMLIVGDSFHEPSFPTYHINGIPTLLQEALGVDNMIPAASGGTGFLNDGSRVSFADRIDKDLTLAPNSDPQIDVILLCDSGNDGAVLTLDNVNVTQNQAAFVAAKDYCYAQARAAWPNATILGIGPCFKQAGGASLPLSDYMEATTAAACAAHGGVYVSGMSAAVGALDSTTRDSYYHPDGHPNDAGHAWIAAKMAELIKAVA